MIEIKINTYFDQMSIRELLASFYLAKSKIYLLREHILLNEKKASLDDHLKLDDNVLVDFTSLKAESIEPYDGVIDVIYEDQDLLIIDKQAHILVHTDGQTIDTLTNRIAYHYKTYPNQILPVHRLDYDTSGLLVFAKHPLAHSFLSYQFENRFVKKTYLAYVEGVIKEAEGEIDKPIGKDRHDNKQRVTKDGKPSKTLYKVLDRHNDRTFLKVHIIGGRKHQIRVHLASIGHPVVGDKLYGHQLKTENGLKLHFKHIKFIHPVTRQSFEIETEKKDQF